MYSYDALTIPSNLAGNCSISVPAGKVSGIPVGIQLMCDKLEDYKLLEIAKGFENIIQLDSVIKEDVEWGLKQ